MLQWTRKCRYLFEMGFTSFGYVSDVGLLNNMAVLVLIFWGISMVAIPMSIPTNREKAFPFLHILPSTYFFFFFLIIAILPNVCFANETFFPLLCIWTVNAGTYWIRHLLCTVSGTHCLQLLLWRFLHLKVSRAQGHLTCACLSLLPQDFPTDIEAWVPLGPLVCSGQECEGVNTLWNEFWPIGYWHWWIKSSPR